MSIVDFLEQHWRVIGQDPWAFVGAIVASGSIAAFFLAYIYNGRIQTLKERLHLKDDKIKEYENKLNGATPDEAKKRLEELEAKFTDLHKQTAPRRLSDAQKNEIAKHARFSPGEITVTSDMGCFDAQAYAEDFISTLSASGWATGDGSMTGVPLKYKSKEGLKFIVYDMSKPSPAATCLMKGLDAAGILYSVAQQIRKNPNEPEYVELLITRPGD